MRTLFIEARSERSFTLPKELVKSLPKKVALFMSVQFLDSLKNIEKQLKSESIEVVKIKPKHCQYECQLLGCSVDKFEVDVDAFLYIGDGYFHPKALVLKNDKTVFSYNPFSEKFEKLTKEDVESIRKKTKGALLKFHTSKNIGVLITVKPGQNKLKEAEKLKKSFPEKKFYMLVADTIDFNSLEDFNFIECFVNTACPRIAFDDAIKISKPIIDIDDLN